MGAPQFMVRVVDETTGALGAFLPDFASLDLTPIFSQAGTVVVKYPQNGINFNLLTEDTELAVVIDGAEVGELRCTIEQIEGDDANEASDGMVWTFTCRTTLALLDRAVVYPQNWPGTNPPNYTLTNVNPGNVVYTLMSAAQSRGALANITMDFTATHDSNGASWDVVIGSIAYDAGAKLSDVIQNLVDNGLIEVRMDKRTLSVYKPDSLGQDKSTGANALRFQAGRDIKESPRKLSTRDLATTLLVAGTNNVYAEEVSDSSTMSTWGRRESYWSANNSDQKPVLDFFGSNKLATLNRPILEVTHGLFFDADSNPRPIRDFNLGDWALSDVGNGWERYRIKQWVLSVDTSSEVSGSVSLNDLIAEQIQKLNSRLGNLENGSTETGSSEEKDDGKPPAQPGQPNLATDFYLDYNQARAFITATWPPVVTNSDGTAAGDISYYLVRWRYVGATDWQPAIRTDALTAYFSGLFTNRQVEVEVQAVDKYTHVSAWSISAIATTAKDVTAPNKPSSPVVTSNVGALRVIWDGRDSAGAAMPADFAGVEVHIGTDGAFTPSPSTLKDWLPSATQIATTITGLAYGTEWFARLVAVDTSGNKSSPSDLSSTSHAVLQQVVTTEIGTGQVGLANTAFSDVGNLIDDGSFELPTFRTSRQSLITGTHLAFDSAVASTGSWSLRSDSFSAGSIEYFTLQDALPVKPGERIFGALDVRATSGATGSVNLDLAWLNAAGSVIDNSGAVNNVFQVLGGLSNTVRDNAWHTRVTAVSQVAPPGAVAMRIILYTNGRTTGTVWVDSIEVRRQVDTLLVADAAITNAKIGLLAVNDANIATASISKLIAGTLSADMTVSARIKTADTGARVEVNSSGLQIYNSGNTLTGSFNSADGSIDITGTLRSGSSGTRIEINPNGLPTIRLYSGAGTEYGFINGFTLSGTDVGVGFNSSPFSGNSTQLVSRLVAFASQASVEVIRSDNQQTSGGYLWAQPGALTGGYNKLADQGASFSATATEFYIDADGSNHGFVDVASTYSKIGINPGASNENTMYFDPGFTRHYGRWTQNDIASSNTQGLVMGKQAVTSGFSGLTLDYGPTMATGMQPMCTLSSATFDNTTGTNTAAPFWGISAGVSSTTSFAIGWDKGIAVTVIFWCFRT